MLEPAGCYDVPNLVWLAENDRLLLFLPPVLGLAEICNAIRLMHDSLSAVDNSASRQR